MFNAHAPQNTFYVVSSKIIPNRRLLYLNSINRLANQMNKAFAVQTH